MRYCVVTAIACCFSIILSIGPDMTPPMVFAQKRRQDVSVAGTKGNRKRRRTLCSLTRQTAMLGNALSLVYGTLLLIGGVVGFLVRGVWTGASAGG